MNQPVPRPDIYDQYWRFAHKRQSAFLKRLSGAPRPWSDDPIIERYKFCNVYRATDRVSQYLIREVIYSDPSAEPADLFFRIVAFRLFSQIDTWRGLVERLGRQPVLEDLANGSLVTALDDIKRVHGKLYTHAFILCANDAYHQGAKHLNHAALLRDMFFESGLASFLLNAQSLQAIVRRLMDFPLIGRFMSYQIAIDLNYSPRVNFDEDDFTQAGPGCLRGIAKVFTDTGSLSPEQIVLRMVDQQEEEFARLGLDFPGLFGRRLHAIDCQGLFCETDKYLREAAPQLTSARSRIKAQFLPAREAPPSLFFPPKWNISLSNF